LPLATWLASGGGSVFENGETLIAPWEGTLVLTGLCASMAVNALVTALIVFKILKVFLEVRATSVERTLDSLALSSGSPKLQHIIFIIIESGMALFAIQLVRVVIFGVIELQASPPSSPTLPNILDIVIPIHQTLNVIIRSVHFLFLCFTDDIYLARVLHPQ
jgi:hypothetical protein